MPINKKTIALLIIIFIAFLISIMPASVALSVLPQQANFAASGVNGSIWKGSARRIRVGQHTMDGIRWDMNVLSLLLGNVSADIRIKDKALPSKGQAAYNVFSGAVSLNDFSSKVPGSILSQWLPMKGVHVAGTFMADIAQFDYKQPMIQQSTLELDWHSAFVKTPFGQADLGHLIIQAKKVAEGEIHLKIREVEDVLGLDADVVLKQSGEISATGEMQANVSQQLQMITRMLGKKQGDKIMIDYKGIVPIPETLKF